MLMQRLEIPAFSVRKSNSFRTQLRSQSSCLLFTFVYIIGTLRNRYTIMRGPLYPLNYLSIMKKWKEQYIVNMQTAILVWITVIKAHGVTIWDIFSGEKRINKASTLQCCMKCEEKRHTSNNFQTLALYRGSGGCRNSKGGVPFSRRRRNGA